VTSLWPSTQFQIKTPSALSFSVPSTARTVIHRACRQTSSAGCMSAGPSPSIPLSEREMQMTSEMSEKSYQAVRCSYCSEPIPLSTRLLKLFVTVFDNTAEPRSQSQVFILRCEACSKESRYLKAEIDTFEGEPRQSGDLNRFSPRGGINPGGNGGTGDGSCIIKTRPFVSGGTRLAWER
jgi:hypothetical protein